jgi:hypothetical protein
VGNKVVNILGGILGTIVILAAMGFAGYIETLP